MEFTQKEFIIYGALAGGLFGIVLGLIILILGFKRNRRKLGVVGLVLTVVAGPISGIVALIVAGIFVWLILKKPSAGSSVNIPSTEESHDE